MQKYVHIIESYACIVEIFVMMYFFSMNFLISFGNVKPQSYQNILHYYKELSNEFVLIYTHQDLLDMFPLF